MGSEVQENTEENRATPTLPLFSLPPLRSPEHPGSGTLTPPLHTLASVPFQWEQEPGKPLPCTALALPFSTNTLNDFVKSLELPPRLTKTPSPTTVLEGPYNSNNNSVGRSILESSSFRFLRKRQGSFDGTLSLGGSRGSSPDRGLLGAMVLSNSNTKKDKRLFGSWRKRSGGGFNFKSRSEAHVGNFVFPSFSDDGTVSFDDDGSTSTVQMARNMSRKRSLLRLSHANSHFWATIYGALKQVIPRRSTKWRKDVS